MILYTLKYHHLTFHRALTSGLRLLVQLLQLLLAEGLVQLQGIPYLPRAMSPPMVYT